MTGAKPSRHLLWVFPGFGVGGAQVRFCALANAWGAACRHSVVSLNGDLACRERLDAGLDLDFPLAGHMPGRMIQAVRHARRFLGHARPNLVITSNWGAIEWAIGAKLAGLEHVHTEDGFGPEERNTQIQRRVLTRRLALRRSTVVLPSQTLAQIAAAQWRLPPARLRVIANGINLQRFSSAKPMPLPPGEGPVIGTIAALRPEKNIARLITAFGVLRAARPARLVIVGDGPARSALEAQVNDAGLTSDTLFAGHSTQAERWLAAFDIFALSSDTEQMPLGLLEAMAAGLPAVATDVGDVATMLAAENARFVMPVDDAAFADGLVGILDVDRTAIGAANRKRAVAMYGQERMALAWAEVLGVEAE